MAGGGDAYLFAGAHQLHDHLAAGVGLARPGRALHGQHRAAEVRSDALHGVGGRLTGELQRHAGRKLGCAAQEQRAAGCERGLTGRRRSEPEVGRERLRELGQRLLHRPERRSLVLLRQGTRRALQGLAAFCGDDVRVAVDLHHRADKLPRHRALHLVALFDPEFLCREGVLVAVAPRAGLLNAPLSSSGPSRRWRRSPRSAPPPSDRGCGSTPTRRASRRADASPPSLPGADAPAPHPCAALGQERALAAGARGWPLPVEPRPSAPAAAPPPRWAVSFPRRSRSHACPSPTRGHRARVEPAPSSAPRAALEIARAQRSPLPSHDQHRS